MSTSWLIAIFVAVLIVAALAFYAGRLLWQLKAQNQRIAKQQQVAREKRQQRNLKLAESIHLIARAMKEKQCEYSEGALRIWMLMTQYYFEPEIDKEQTFSGIFKLYEVVKDMPTHDARKKYSKKEIYKQDVARWQAEKQYEQVIDKDLEKILELFAHGAANNVVFQ